MAKFCKYCGTNLKEEAKFCFKCGRAQDGTLAESQTPVLSQTNRKEGKVSFDNCRYNNNSSSSKTIVVALMVIVVFLIFIGMGLYLYNSNETADSVKNNIEQSQSAQDSSKKSETSMSDESIQNQKNDSLLSEMVKEKDDIDVAIGEVAGKVNGYISQHSDFRAATTLKSEVKTLLDRTRNAEKRAKNIVVNDTAKRDALVHLFALEEGRIQGLYKGMIDSSNGGDYSFGFQSGTKNSYAFDTANTTFNQNYK